MLLCLLLFGGGSISAADDALVIGPRDRGPISLTAFLSVLEDADRSMTLDDVRRPEVAGRFEASHAAGDSLNFSYTRSAVWLRFRLRNDGAEPLERLLQIGKARLSSVELYYPLPDGGHDSYATGDLRPFAARPYPNRHYVFPLTIPAHGEQVLYLRVWSDSAMFIPARLWDIPSFHAHERDDYFWQAWYFGMALAMILFNLLIFIALRDVIYLLYVGFSSCMVFAIAALNGLVAEFMPIESPLFSRMSSPIGFSLTVAIFLLFMRQMLRTAVLMPRVDVWLRMLVALNLAGAAGFLVAVEQLARPTQVLYLVSMLAIMSVGVYCAIRRQRSAYFFVAAFAVLFVAGMTTSIAALGLLPANAVSMNALQFGSALEMLLLAFALADRFNVMRREKENAQRQALDAQRRLVDNLKSSERVLEERVASRTAELSDSNAELASSLAELQATQARLIASEQRAVDGQRIAREALDDQRQFIAMVSHEFRSPLAVIDAGVQVLAAKLRGAADATPVLARIRRGVSRLSGFLDNCLTEDRLNGEGMNLQPEAVDLATLAASAREGAQLMSDEHRIVTEIEAGLPALHGDPQLLRVLLINLLGNAVKYSPAGGEIQLRVGRTGRNCRLEVVDRGRGIASEDLPVVFRKYARGRAVQSIPGAGLGLSLVARIVALHGGAIDVDSREGAGTRVVVTLPFEAETIQETEEMP